MISRISDSMRKELIELGREGNIINMRFRELIKGIEKKLEEMIRDYSSLSLKKTKLILSNLTFESLTEIDSIARLVFQKELEDSISPKGFRFLIYLGVNERESSGVIRVFENLNNLLELDEKKLEEVFKNRVPIIKQEIIDLREQILEGKAVF
jgi:DNA integrity scanning protein DisA with diadenylate cyclase activity